MFTDHLSFIHHGALVGAGSLWPCGCIFGHHFQWPHVVPMMCTIGLHLDTLLKQKIKALEKELCDIYLWIKVVCLFCTYEIHQARMLQIVFFVSLESSWGGGVHRLGFMASGLVVQKFLNMEWFLHWKLNEIVAENVGGIGMCLWCCWKDLDG